MWSFDCLVGCDQQRAGTPNHRHGVPALPLVTPQQNYRKQLFIGPTGQPYVSLGQRPRFIEQQHKKPQRGGPKLINYGRAAPLGLGRLTSSVSWGVAPGSHRSDPLGLNALLHANGFLRNLMYGNRTPSTKT